MIWILKRWFSGGTLQPERLLRTKRLVKESLGLEKKIKTSKASGLEKEDKELKGPYWTIWLRWWQNWTLNSTPILRADCVLPEPPTPFIRLTKSSHIASAKPPLKYEASRMLHTLSLVIRPTVAPPSLNNGNLSPLRSSSFLHRLVSNYTLQLGQITYRGKRPFLLSCSLNVSPFCQHFWWHRWPRWFSKCPASKPSFSGARGGTGLPGSHGQHRSFCSLLCSGTKIGRGMNTWEERPLSGGWHNQKLNCFRCWFFALLSSSLYLYWSYTLWLSCFFLKEK